MKASAEDAKKAAKVGDAMFDYWIKHGKLPSRKKDLKLKSIKKT